MVLLTLCTIYITMPGFEPELLRLQPGCVTNELHSSLRMYTIRMVASSVVDPNTLNLDPDPEFSSNLDLDPGLCYKFLKNYN